MRATAEADIIQGVYQISTSKGCQQACKMVDAFVSRCGNMYSQCLVSVILTGSLARGSYQPGLSDVDLITVLDDNSPGGVRTGVSRLYRQIGHDYNIQFEPIILRYRDFWPPWDNNLCIQPELLRLKASGKTLLGEDIIGDLPTPTKGQMWKFDLSFREWLLKSRHSDWQNWTLKSSLKAILGQASSYFYYKTGIVEYSKHSIGDLFSHHIPNFPHLSTLKLASYLWRHYPDNVDAELRVQMADQARDFSNYVTLSLGFGEKYLIQ